MIGLLDSGAAFALLVCAKATILLGLAAACQATLGHRMSAASRHLLWVFSLVGLISLPVLIPLLPIWAVRAPVVSIRDGAGDPGAASETAGSAAPTPPHAVTGSSPAARGSGKSVRAAGEPGVRGWTVPVVLGLVYLLGALVVLGRLAAERIAVRELNRYARRNTHPRWDALLDELRPALGITRPVALLRSSEAVMPLTWGTRSPKILVPDSADRWSEDRLRAVLLHELAHIARYDALSQVPALLACAIYWFHPGVWWAARRLRIESELACDDRVLAAGTGAHEFAGHLLEIARTTRATPAGAAICLTRPSMLEGRMRAILDHARNRALPQRRTVAAWTVAASVLLVVLAGVGVADSQGAGVAGLVAAPVLVEDLRIGGRDPAYHFEGVQSLAVGNDGAIFVADQPRLARVRMYDAAGHFVRDVGEAGEAPGQYRHVTGMLVTPAGEVAIYDVFNQRISIFDGKGTFVRSLPSRVGGNWTGNDFHVDEEGNFYVFGIRVPTEERPIPIGETPAPQRAVPRNNRFYLKLSPRGEILDTLDIPASDIPRRPGFAIMTPETNLVPFLNELVFDLTPQGRFVHGYTSDYSFDIETGPGHTTHVIREYQPVRLNESERAQWQARADFYTRRHRGSASAGVTIPEIKPAYRDIDVAEDGRIWVNRYAVATERHITVPRPADAPPALTWRDIPTFDVFESDGKFLWTVVVPENTRIAVRKGSRLWGTQVSPTGETDVVRYGMR